MESGSQRIGRTSHPPGRNSELPGYLGRSKASDRGRSVEDILALRLRQKSRGKLCPMSRDGASFAENSWHDIRHVLDSSAKEAYPGTPRIVEGCPSLSPRIDCS